VPPIPQLWPPPRHLRHRAESFVVPDVLRWEANGDHPTLAALSARLAAALKRRGTRLQRAEGEVDLRLVVMPGVAPPQGYRLEVGAQGIQITGADSSGLFYGACTLAQWLELHDAGAPGGTDGGALPGARIEDWPDLLRRGVLLDVSRDKVPTMATLHALVDRLASWKVNQLQLYTEHTFAYRGHERVWADASPLTAEEVRELDAHCHGVGIELVPNQNSFGHFHRWLVHEPYRQLAEVPEGIEHPFGDRKEPFSLCPIDPGSLQLLADLYDQLLPNFTSRELNVGLDETFDLGKGRSAAAVGEKGRVRVYLEFLQEVHRLVAARGHRMQFWGDIIIEQPELIPELPADAIALEWGYEADHPFLDHAQRFADSGLDFMVCPGTSSWNSLAGRADNALRNLALAAVAGVDAGARGYLITDWGDFGHLQPLPVSYLGFLAGAGFSWNVAAAAAPLGHPWAELLDRWAFDDTRGVTGRAALGLGDAYLRTGASQKNGTALFYLLAFPQQDLEQRRYRGLSSEGLGATERWIAAAAAPLAGDVGRPEGNLVHRELRWVAGLLGLACRLGKARLAAGPTVAIPSLPAAARAELLAELQPLIEEHREVWLARNRPGGRADSVARLERLARLLAGEGNGAAAASNRR
jgi:hexosaminidase